MTLNHNKLRNFQKEANQESNIPISIIVYVKPHFLHVELQILPSSDVYLKFACHGLASVDDGGHDGFCGSACCDGVYDRYHFVVS